MWTEFQRSGIFDEVVQSRTLATFLETLTLVSACWWFCLRNYLDLQYPQMNLNNLATCGLSFSAVESWIKFWNGVLCLPSGNFAFVSCWWFCFPEPPRPPVPADEFEQSCNMWTEFQRSGIFDEVVQWRTLCTFLETLTFVSACWWFCFPGLPRPPVPADECKQSCNMWTAMAYFVYLSGNFDVCLSMLVVLLPGTTSTSSTRR